MRYQPQPVTTPKSAVGTRRGTWITLRVRRWLERAERDFSGASCGGDQRCPWCKQWVNQFNGTHSRPFSEDSFLDEIICGNCQGTSLWRWEMGFAYVTHGDPPKMPSSDFGSGPFIQGVIQRARAVIDGRALSGCEGNGTEQSQTVEAP